MNASSLIHALVLGDVMLDLYTHGRADRLSPEAPVPVLRADNEEARLGGAGAVATLLAALEVEPTVAGIVGDDSAGAVVTSLLRSVQHVPESTPSGVLADTERGRQADKGSSEFRPAFSAPCRLVPLSPCRDSAPSLRPSVSPSLLLTHTRPTTVKQRFLAQSSGRHAQQLLRVDRESCAPLAGQDEDYLLAAALAAIDQVQAVLVSDYGKGVCTPKITSAVIRATWKRKLPVLVDPCRGGDYSIYRWATVIKPNRHEAAEATGREIRSRTEAFAAGKELCRRWGFRAAVITLDADGLVLVTNEGLEKHFTAHRREVVDVTGAGDTVLAVLGAALARSRTLSDACQLATAAAGLQVERVGVSRISWGEINAVAAPSGTPNDKETRRGGDKESCEFTPPGSSPCLLVSPSPCHSKPGHGVVTEVTANAQLASPRAVSPSPCQPISLEALKQQIALHRSRGQRIIFANGCFDLLHAGHIHCLTAAKALGDVLVVAVNSDASVRRVKGDSRPIVGERDRAAMLAALACVDYVTIFDEDTPERLIAEIRPDVLVKGAESRPDGIAGAALVASYGGRLELIPFLPDHSTSSLVARLRSDEKGSGFGVQGSGTNSPDGSVGNALGGVPPTADAVQGGSPTRATPNLDPSLCPMPASIAPSSLCVLACGRCQMRSDSLPLSFDYDSCERGPLNPEP